VYPLRLIRGRKGSWIHAGSILATPTLLIEHTNIMKPDRKQATEILTKINGHTVEYFEEPNGVPIKSYHVHMWIDGEYVGKKTVSIKGLRQAGPRSHLRERLANAKEKLFNDNT
jgi:hypothetical protein